MMRKSLFWVCVVLSLTGGILAWRVDSGNDEPQAAVLVILVVTFMLGFLLPNRAWLWGLIVGLCLPLSYLLSRSFGYLPQTMVEPGWYAAAIALIPALIGVYAGSFARFVINSATAKT
jgi:hypothetical protein